MNIILKKHLYLISFLSFYHTKIIIKIKYSLNFRVKNIINQIVIRLCHYHLNSVPFRYKTNRLKSSLVMKRIYSHQFTFEKLQVNSVRKRKVHRITHNVQILNLVRIQVRLRPTLSSHILPHVRFNLLRIKKVGNPFYLKHISKH